MQQRPVVIAIAVIAAIAAGGLLLFALTNRGPDSAALTGRTWQLASITGETPAFQGVVPAAEQPRYTIAFDDAGTFTARADCNTLAGTYELRDRDGMAAAMPSGVRDGYEKLDALLVQLRATVS